MMKQIFKVISKIYPFKSNERFPGKYTKAWVMFIHIVRSLQRLRMIWQSNSSILNWENYKVYWYYLSYLSIEELFADLNSLFGFFILSSILLTISLVFIVVFTVYVLTKKFQSAFMQKSLKFIFDLLTGVLFIPIMLINSLVVKYSYKDISGEITECIGNQSTKALSLGYSGIGSGLFWLAYLFALSYAKEGFSYEIRHCFYKNNLESKALPDSNIQDQVLTMVIVFVYVFTGDEHYAFYLGFSAAIYFYLAFKYVWNLPYYADFMNFCHAFVQFEAFCCAIFFSIGLTMNNATVILVLSTFMQPLIVLVVLASIEYRKSKIAKPTSHYFGPLSYFELACRKKLLKQTPNEKVCKYIIEYFNRKKIKLSLVFLAHHCFHKLLQNRRALIHISHASYTGSDIFSNFQVYKCQKYLESLNYTFSEGLKLSVFLQKFAKIKNLELELFTELIGLCDCFQSTSPTLHSLKNHISKFTKFSAKTKSYYKKTLSKYPNSELLNEMFGSLLSMLGKHERGKKLLDRASFYHEKTMKRNKILNIFSDKNSYIMIVSGNKEDIGRITYMSQSLSTFLSINHEDYSNYNLNDFIPEYFHSVHHKNMMRFIDNFDNDKLFRNFSLCMKNGKGFLVECFLNLDCIGYRSKIQFITAINPIVSQGREIALITYNGEILDHSENFLAYLNEPSQSPQINDMGQQKSGYFNKISIKGCNILRFFTTLTLEQLHSYMPFFCHVYSSQEKQQVKIALLLQTKAISSTNIYILYLVTDPIAINHLEAEAFMKNSKKKLTWILNLESSGDTDYENNTISEENFKKGSTQRRSVDLGKSQEPIYSFLEIGQIKKTMKIIRTIKSLKIFTVLSVRFI